MLEPSTDRDGTEEQRGDGMKVLDRIMETIEVNPKNNRPKDKCRVVIEACGQI